MPTDTPTPQTYRLPQSIQQAVNAPAPAPQYVRAEGLPTETPSTHAACAEAWQKYSPLLRNQRLAPEDRKRILEIGKRAYALQQGLPTIETDHQEIARARGVAICTGEATRQTQTDALRAALAANFDGDPIVPSRELSPGLLDFIASSDGIKLAAALRAELAEYQIKRNDLFALVAPETRAQERKVALNSRPTPEKSAKIADEAALTINPHFPELCANARAELAAFWQARISPKELAMIDAALAFVAEHKQASIEAEKQFFAAYGLPRESTGVSKQHDATLAELEHRREHLTKGPGTPVAGISTMVRGVDHSVLELVFGVPLLQHPVEWWAAGRLETAVS